MEITKMVKKNKNVRLKEETIQELKLQAVKLKINDSELIERYITEGLTREKKKDL